MKIPFMRPRSAGVPVSHAVHRLLTAANAARDRRDWKMAASGYREALTRMRRLRHIWIQLGHAEQEAGDLDAAEAAYRQAEKLDGGGGDPALFLGHVAKLRGDGAAAAGHYLRATRRDPNNADAASELYAMVERRGGMSRNELAAALGISIEHPSQDPPVPAGDHTAGPALVFDASDLISYFRSARLPTGIQRVQIETISSALRSAGKRTVKVCCFTEYRDEWMEIPAALFLELAALSVADGDRSDPEWNKALNRLRLTLAFADRLILPDGAFLINLGTSWWLQNYFLFVRQAKAGHGIRYIPFVHDFIPVMTPEHCTKELTQDFIAWAVGVFQHADFFLVNSEATKRDLLKVAAILGHPVDPDHVAVIPLNADFRNDRRVPLAEHGLTRFGLKGEDYILFVSTIESRKNHVVAFDAWLRLVDKHGPGRVPKLVCVGNKGWLNDAVHARLDESEVLRSHVVMLSHLSDEELTLLYRNCLFTLYPSQYEGWGLPVTESLCYGKVPLIADISSLPEAGGPYADYFTSGSVDHLAAALDRLMFDMPYRQARERKILEEFRPRTWKDIAAQIEHEVSGFCDRAGPPVAMTPSVARIGEFYPLTRNREMQIWRGLASAEMFRAGSGWWWPDDWGCWTKKDGGRLEIGLSDTGHVLRVYIQLVGPPVGSCDYRVRVDAEDLELSGELTAGEIRWIALDIVKSGKVLTIDFLGSVSADLASPAGGLDGRVMPLGVVGFIIAPATDITARAEITEAIALGNTAELAFNRRRPDPAPREAGRPLNPADALRPARSTP